MCGVVRGNTGEHRLPPLAKRAYACSAQIGGLKTTGVAHQPALGITNQSAKPTKLSLLAPLSDFAYDIRRRTESPA